MMKIKADFHVHTRWSHDCLIKPSDLIKKAKTVGLNVLGITDHNTIMGGIEAKNLASEILVIPGIEIKTEIGDLIALFIEDDIKSRQVLELIDEVKSAQGILVLPHPSHGHKFHKVENLEEIISHIKAIEVINASHGGIDELGLLMSKKYNLSVLSGSDAHTLDCIGSAYTILKVEELSEEHLRKAILKGDVEPVLNTTCNLKHKIIKGIVGILRYHERIR